MLLACLLLTSLLFYCDILVKDPSVPSLPERDRFILSKAAGAAVCAVSAESGYFSPDL